MVSKHCVECGVETHPNLRHPSSFRVEVSVWAVAIMIGLIAGVWSAATSSSSPTLSRAMQTITLSTVESVDQPLESSAATNPNASSLRMEFVTWARGVLLDFLRTAWWVLPLPIAFSLWRQFKKRPVCAACGSRELVPVVVEHGEFPPAG
ncbi:MAG: hypothetical protein JSW51_12890 [Gemmatimonadota bacterium]|nr:MAG: hypothetical protein JSW51_12890 [Gemmatimonadota bacterium]